MLHEGGNSGVLRDQALPHTLQKGKVTVREPQSLQVARLPSASRSDLHPWGGQSLVLAGLALHVPPFRIQHQRLCAPAAGDSSFGCTPLEPDLAVRIF
mmetsp:Transcript_34188/g.79480  ORF Transcript_34188/g.79480 Transcript_34188/m.79480 type:complete len:98 (+) Transcript_34188:711-1004(+)